MQHQRRTFRRLQRERQRTWTRVGPSRLVSAAAPRQTSPLPCLACAFATTSSMLSALLLLLLLLRLLCACGICCCSVGERCARSLAADTPTLPLSLPRPPASDALLGYAAPGGSGCVWRGGGSGQHLRRHPMRSPFLATLACLALHTIACPHCPILFPSSSLLLFDHRLRPLTCSFLLQHPTSSLLPRPPQPPRLPLHTCCPHQPPHRRPDVGNDDAHQYPIPPSPQTSPQSESPLAIPKSTKRHASRGRLLLHPSHCLAQQAELSSPVSARSIQYRAVSETIPGEWLSFHQNGQPAFQSIDQWTPRRIRSSTQHRHPGYPHDRRHKL